MSNATITGSITFPIVADGANSSVLIGSPSVTSSSTSGLSVTYNEGGSQTLSVATASPTTLPVGTVGSSSVFYVGSNAPVNLILNGGAETISIGAGGFVMLCRCNITAATVQATSSQAVVTFIALGD